VNEKECSGVMNGVAIDERPRRFASAVQLSASFCGFIG
jgi:hypothetical protein